MVHKGDAEIIRTTHNSARFFSENRHVSWVVLLSVILWGIYGYVHMPKRKDPLIPARVAVATCPWPGVNAEKIEQLVTRPLEARVAESSALGQAGSGTDFGIKSVTLPGLAIVYVQLAENIKDTRKEFNDINLKLNDLNQNLPQGAGPIQFNSNFGDTAALMLTVASPKENEVEIALRARAIERAIIAVRAQAPSPQAGARATMVAVLPQAMNPQILQRLRDLLAASLSERDAAHDIRPLQGPGFVGLDAVVHDDDKTILTSVLAFAREQLGLTGSYPDAWQPIIIRNPQETEARLAAAVGDKYPYWELDDITNLLQRSLQTIPQVSMVSRSGVLPERIFLDYSQEQFASYGLQPLQLKDTLSARNIPLGGGMLQIGDTNLLINPSGEFTSEQEIGEVIIAKSDSGAPVYLRDLVDITHSYENPPRFLNFYTWQDATGAWQRSRAITLAVQMRAGEQIAHFGKAIDEKLAELRQHLPADLILARTSDQPRQVEENIDLFMSALYEALLLVILVSWIGFWEWRSAFLMALSIPLTLTMTFGALFLLGVDLQQVSIASLIIALGLLVDDPVVAGDAIKRDLALGHPPGVAAWLGPTKLAKAILFATITNIVAYLPFLLLTGNTGTFLYSMPVVMTCTLAASRVVSMTFVPFFGYYLLRMPKTPEPSIAERRQRGFTGLYYRIGYSALEHRWLWCVVSIAFLGSGVVIMGQLKSSFFPEDVQYLSYVDVWLPNNAPLSATNAAAVRTEEIIREVTEEYGRQYPNGAGQPRKILRSLTNFVGGGSPRFWFSLSPELQQLNYAQLTIEVTDKDDTPRLAGLLQRALSAAVPGAFIEVHQLQTNPVAHPIEVHVSERADLSPRQQAGDVTMLRRLAKQVKDIFRTLPQAANLRDDWFDESFVVKLQVDPDRANLVGISNVDVASSSAAGINGAQVTTLRQGDKQIPVLARLRLGESARLSDIQNLYIYAAQSSDKVPLLQVSSVQYGMETQRIVRRDHFRTVTVTGSPVPGELSSTVMHAAAPQLAEFSKKLPPGYTLLIGGEQAKQIQGFGDLALVMAISVGAIFLTLVLQFNNAVKPFLVFAAVPYGLVGALAALYVMGTSFGFMAFLGIASLVGVIVSHVIVLFDFIEE
ncbi:MAG: efflux RND transporter permease subunit, partial [Deltaproteobacteria bacterium]|nr:efflux RND transporter permease subunit [Deltaproteobacteria bacterium]